MLNSYSRNADGLTNPFDQGWSNNSIKKISITNNIRYNRKTNLVSQLYDVCTWDSCPTYVVAIVVRGRMATAVCFCEDCVYCVTKVLLR